MLVWLFIETNENEKQLWLHTSIFQKPVYQVQLLTDPQLSHFSGATNKLGLGSLWDKKAALYCNNFSAQTKLMELTGEKHWIPGS